jgi:hypothetical protein
VIIMAEGRRQLLTIGAFLVIVVVALLLAPFIGWGLVVPVILVLFGGWMLALAAMRGSNPQKYERSSFSTLSLGVLMIVVGGAWAMLVLGLDWVYALALILLMLGALAIAAASKRK